MEGRWRETQVEGRTEGRGERGQVGIEVGDAGGKVREEDKRRQYIPTIITLQRRMGMLMLHFTCFFVAQ